MSFNDDPHWQIPLHWYPMATRYKLMNHRKSIWKWIGFRIFVSARLCRSDNGKSQINSRTREPLMACPNWYSKHSQCIFQLPCQQMPKSSETPEWLSVTCWWKLVGYRTMTGGDAVVRPGRQWGGSAQLRDDCGRVAGEDRAQGLGRQHLDLLHHGRQGWGLLWPSTWQRFWSTCLNSRI